MKIDTFNNNIGDYNGTMLLQKFFRDCRVNSKELDNRNYHIGLKSVLNDNTRNTIFFDDILTKAEGLSPRLLLMR